MGSRLAPRPSVVAMAGVALGLVLSSVSVAATPPPARVDADHDGIDDHLEQKLAERYAPILFIEPDESNYPVNVEWFLARAHLQYHEDCTFDIDEDVGYNPISSQANLIGPTGAYWAGGPNCGEDDTGYGHPPHHVLTTVAADPDGQFSVGSFTTGYSDQQTFVLPDVDDSYRLGSTDPREWKTYFHVYPSADGGVMIQYWHVFTYNQLAILGVGRHGGDWDASIQVQLGPDLEVEGVWFSRHADDHPGNFFETGNSNLHFAGTHPLMAIDGGGHAAFANPDDFCGHAATAVVSAIAWPVDVGVPDDPARLGLGVSTAVGCGFVTNNGNGIGGIVWETWTGGRVLASAFLSHPISAPSGHGGLVNMGEYNPCTPTTCFGSAQASSLLAGQFYPLNGQTFIQYSGKWGSLPHIQSFVGNPPRGPVFQGFEDRGMNATSMYTAWYNNGGNSPADRSNSPWREPPATSFQIPSGPTYPRSDGVRFVSSTTSLALTATESSIAMRFGPPVTAYRVFPAAASAGGPYLPYDAPFRLTGGDGAYAINYFSHDGLDNEDAVGSQVLTLDDSPPASSIAAPVAAPYVHSATLTLAYSATDGAGAGLRGLTATLDGHEALAGHVLSSGQAIDLLTQLRLGTHTFAIDAVDNLGNTRDLAVTFTIIATPESIEDDVRQFLAAGKIKPHGLAHRLLAELHAAAEASERGHCRRAADQYREFIDVLHARRGRGVDPEAAHIMISDARYLIAHCPDCGSGPKKPHPGPRFGDPEVDANHSCGTLRDDPKEIAEGERILPNRD